MKADNYKSDSYCCLQHQVQYISHTHRCKPVLGAFSERVLAHLPSAEESGTM